MMHRLEPHDARDFVEDAERLQAAYRAERVAYREANPDRGHEIDERAVYVAPPHLRVRVGGAE